jgi:hypothetical protein
MNLRERIRSWLQPIYFLGQNTLTLTGAVITTSTALTTIAFWFYEIFLPAPPHPYIGILFFLISPGIFVLGLLLIPLGIWLRRQTLRARGKLPRTFPAIDLHLPVVRRTFSAAICRPCDSNEMLLGFGVSFTCRCQDELCRMDAALNRVEPGTLAPILRALGFHSLEQIDCLESLQRVVLEAASGGKYPLNLRRQRKPFKSLFIVRMDSSSLIEDPAVRR